MKYRTNPKNNDSLSALGFGCMRFPKDEKETEKIILHAIEKGVNYFDTAYLYGNSEATLGKVLNRNNKRTEVKIATKIPPALIKKHEDLDKYLTKQLERLQTDYIDYYFIHMMTDVNVWKRLSGLGIEKWIDEKKKEGKIRNIGFSYHGGKDEFVKICDAYSWEFCMIYYNYLDENNQAGKSGLIYAASKGLPVMIMGPVRGGMLANNLPKSALKIFEEAHIRRSPTEWALRWLWNQPEITSVVSGMGSIEMVEENLKTANDASESFTEADSLVIQKVRQALTETIKVPCTGCNYCMPCPQGVDIPTCLSCYNDTALVRKMSAISKYASQTALKTKPQIASLCNNCGKCEKLCPQHIKISDELANTAKSLEPFYFKPLIFIAKKFMRL
ncbi:MAG: aldo/keto reductase [Defluviitaleaceae bacterium]|nr:aldo/keto reductase [Defluviitaleaceae bacterium]